jgi:hypothetical protein
VCGNQGSPGGDAAQKATRRRSVSPSWTSARGSCASSLAPKPGDGQRRDLCLTRLTLPLRVISRPCHDESLERNSGTRPKDPTVQRQSEYPQFTLYRCTKSVTYTGSSVFAKGYAFSALLAPPRVANSRVLKPLRTAYRGLPACSRSVS